jgi:hypothetical protein
MHEHNHTSSADPTSIEHELAALKDGLEKLIGRFAGTPKSYLGKITARIEANPLAAIGIAFGLGYLVVRFTGKR